MPADPSLRDAAEVARVLDADPKHGLNSREASRRLARDGPNALRAAAVRPLWRRLLAQFQDPLVYLLLVAVAIALIAWLIEGRVGWPVDAIVIGVVVLLNATLGFVEEARAENAVAALARMTAVTSTVLRDGREQRVPSAQLVRGDVLVLGEGDAVGADARLLHANTLRVLEASLTGESEAVLKDAATLPAAAALGDRLNLVFKGTAVVQGTGRAVITATGMHTEMGAIAGMLDATAEAPTPLQIEVARIGRMLGIAVVAIAIIVVGTILLLSEIHGASDVITVLLLGVSLAVAAVPEGLPAILSVVLALGVQRMARRNAVVKKLSSVETLGSAFGICTDKTGTLTRKEMTIEPACSLYRLRRQPCQRRRACAAGAGAQRRAGTHHRTAACRAGRRAQWAAVSPATPTCARATTAPGRFRATRPKPPSSWPNASWAPASGASDVSSASPRSRSVRTAR